MVTFKVGGGVFWIEEGRYRLTLRDIEEEEGQYGTRNKWTFSPIVNANGETMTDDRGMPLSYFEWTGQSIAPKSNAKPIVEALLGRPIDDLPADAVLEEISQGLGKLTCTAAIMDQTRASDGEIQSRAVKGSWKAANAPAGPAGRRPAASARPAAEPRGDEVPF